MSKTKRKPLISLSLTLGSILTMFGLTNHPIDDQPYCELKIDNPHTSTFLFEQRKKLAIKTNTRTECHSPQKEATVWMNLYQIDGPNRQLIESYEPQTIEGGYSPHLIKFRSFYTYCEKTKRRFTYQSEARALIRLRIGKVEVLESASKKSLPLNCLASTKINS